MTSSFLLLRDRPLTPAFTEIFQVLWYGDSKNYTKKNHTHTSIWRGRCWGSCEAGLPKRKITRIRFTQTDNSSNICAHLCMLKNCFIHFRSFTGCKWWKGKWWNGINWIAWKWNTRLR